jgi:Glycosyltransferase 61
MIAIRPALHALGRFVGNAPAELESIAADRWELAPGSPCCIAPARMLPGQLDRIRGTEFGTPEMVVRELTGGFETWEPPTLAYRLRDVDLIDGVLYGQGAQMHLRARGQRLPLYRAPEAIESASLYESWVGNRWFGNWLTDDCLAYPLAARTGHPVTTRPATGHVPDYEQRLGMAPARIADAHFDELFLFSDHANNADRAARTAAMRTRLIGGRAVTEHPGVFLWRGDTGDRRLLVNEGEIAERLERERGFRVLDPSSAGLDAIVEACAGARVVAGVEGSQMSHGQAIMPGDAAFLALMPPDRVVSVMKIVQDRGGGGFALVIGEGSAGCFRVSWDEVAATLDLL